MVMVVSPSSPRPMGKLVDYPLSDNVGLTNLLELPLKQKKMSPGCETGRKATALN
jgi:hypothetical protein